MEWRDIPDFPHYEVSDNGQVRSVTHQTTYTTKTGITRTITLRGKLLSPKTTRHGYHRVGLVRDGVTHHVVVHRLMLSAFVGPPPFPNACGLHRDDVKTHNTIENLYWGTYAENIQDSLKNQKHRTSGPTCQRGHEWTPENTYVAKSGQRLCRECQRLRDRRRYVKKPALTECRRGHPRISENTYVDGSRTRCKLCANQRERERRAERVVG